jgi:hypothetical protein
MGLSLDPFPPWSRSGTSSASRRTGLKLAIFRPCTLSVEYVLCHSVDLLVICSEENGARSLDA